MANPPSPSTVHVFYKWLFIKDIIHFWHPSQQKICGFCRHFIIKTKNTSFGISLYSETTMKYELKLVKWIYLFCNLFVSLKLFKTISIMIKVISHVEWINECQRIYWDCFHAYRNLHKTSMSRQLKLSSDSPWNYLAQK